MQEAVEQLSARLPARELGAGGVGAGDLLLFFTAVACDWDLDAARRAAARVTQEVARCVRAVLVPLSAAVLAARVRQRHRIVRRLLVRAAVALVVWHRLFGVAVVAVGTRPRDEGTDEPSGAPYLPALAVIAEDRVLLVIDVGDLLLLLILVSIILHL